MSFKTPKRLDSDSAKLLMNNVDNFLFDCDGVIWNWPHAIEGSVECVNKLKSLGKRCFFVTNNNSKTRKMVIEMLNKVGVNNVTEDDVVCTAWLLAGYLNDIGFKDKLYIIGNEAIATELNKYNFKHIGIGSNNETFPDPLHYDYKNQLETDPEVKGVVVAYDHYFNYPKMVLAATYLHNVKNCLFVATNDDSLLPTQKISRAIIPGTGSFVNCIKTLACREPVILGKPNRAMWEILAKTHGLNSSRTCMVGDRLETDIAFAANCSMGYSLAVSTGITNEKEILGHCEALKAGTAEKDAAKYIPDFIAESLGQLGKFL